MYYVLKTDFNETFVFVAKAPTTVKKRYQLNQGISRKNDWPEEAVLDYFKDKPEGMVLTDQIQNSLGWLIVSENFKRILESLDLEYIELLPVQLRDHKDRIRKEAYFIASFTRLFSAVDLAQSIYKNVPGDEGEIDYIKKLVLLEDVEKNGPPLFRLKESNWLTLFREDVKNKIETEHLTGMKFVATEKYKTLDPNA